MDEKFMKLAIDLAKDAAAKGEVPIGAVIVKDGEVIASAENLKERYNCATRHAEMVAMERASKVLNCWWLEDCDLYVTLEPCPMCAGAMIMSRIKNLYFGAYDLKTGACGSKVNLFEKGLFNHDINVQGGVLEEECSEIITNFFSNIRKTQKELKAKEKNQK